MVDGCDDEFQLWSHRFSELERERVLNVIVCRRAISKSDRNELWRKRQKNTMCGGENPINFKTIVTGCCHSKDSDRPYEYEIDR